MKKYVCFNKSTIPDGQTLRVTSPRQFTDLSGNLLHESKVVIDYWGTVIAEVVSDNPEEAELVAKRIILSLNLAPEEGT